MESRFFNAEPFRDAFLMRLIKAHTDSDGVFNVDTKMTEMDNIIHTFLSTPINQRHLLHGNESCEVAPSKVSAIYVHMKSGAVERGQPVVRDFRSKEEVASFFIAFKSRCVVTGHDASRVRHDIIFAFDILNSSNS